MAQVISRKRKSSECHETYHSFTKRNRTSALPLRDINTDRQILRRRICATQSASGIYNPHELFERTFSFLGGGDLHSVQLACRDFHHIVHSSSLLQQRLLMHSRRSRTATAGSSMGEPQHLGLVPGFFQIGQNGRCGTVNLERVPPAGFWRDMAPFAGPAFEIVLRIPGRYSGHPIVRAPLNTRGVTLGMIADSFLQYAPWEFWHGRKAEFFALHVSEEQQVRTAPREQLPTSCGQDAMELDVRRTVAGFESGHTFSSEMMCLN